MYPRISDSDFRGKRVQDKTQRKNVMPKLNDLKVKGLKAPKKGELMISDGGGLYLRVRTSGKAGTSSDIKAWIFRYVFDSKTRKFQLGTYPEISLANARTKVEALRAKVHQGTNPAQEREDTKIALEIAKKVAISDEAARITVATLFDRWASVDLIRRKDGGAEAQRMMAKDVLPFLGSLLVEDVRKGHITGVTDALLARGVTRMAKVIFSLMRQMFRFAVDRDMIEADPTASIRKAGIGGKDVERDRVLSEDEIKDLFVKLPNAGLIPTTESAVGIALSTCARIGELLGARWFDVDFERREWNIPDTKNGKAHKVQLSDFAIAQFEQLKGITGGCEWIYPDRKGLGPVNSKTVTKQLADRQRESVPMSCRSKHVSALLLAGGKWGPHDLRRTGATMMVALGVLPEVAERCLNHTEQNRVKRTYQRHSYDAEMRAAWALLGARLDLLKNETTNIVIGKFERSRAA